VTNSKLTLTVKEAAAAVEVHPDTLRAAIARGEFPHRRLGRRIIVPRILLEEWLRDEKSIQNGRSEGKGGDW
jgi:excisionase family DNA binding protein